MDPTVEKLTANLMTSLKKTFESIHILSIPVESIAKQLALEVSGTARVDSKGRPYAPDQFTLSVHPQSLKGINNWSEEMQAQLAFEVENALRGSHYQFALKPHITLATDPTLGTEDVRVIAWHSSNPLGMQDSIEIEEGDTDKPPSGAFLIVDGKRHFQLSSPRVTIGRRLDNDLVLDDTHVSRRHVHLVARHGHYLLEDLDSTAGTRVNGRRVMEHYLKPGDVITIATNELIYGEDRGGPPDGTPPYTPVPKPETDREFETPLDLKRIKDVKTTRLDE
jgi:pSer/pThr/pTyr-binding forkhead associated (FHA) protein